MVDGVKLLLERGADVGLKTVDSAYTPLHLTAQNNRPICMALLLGAGADPNAKCIVSQSQLDFHHIVTSNRAFTPLDIVLHFGWARASCTMKTVTSCVAALIKAGARVDDPEGQGEHVLLAARGNRSVVKMLLRAGGETPSDSRLIYYNTATLLVKYIKARGGWKAYAAKHKRVLSSLVSKLSAKDAARPIPMDVAGHVVDFWCPRGGY